LTFPTNEGDLRAAKFPTKERAIKRIDRVQKKRKAPLTKERVEGE